MLLGNLVVIFADHVYKPADRKRAYGNIVVFAVPGLYRGPHADGKFDYPHAARPCNKIMPELVYRNEQPENENCDNKGHENRKHLYHSK